MAATKHPTNNNDDSFDPKQYAQLTDAHTATLKELQKAQASLEKRVGTDAALADSFTHAFENDKKMDKVLTALIVDLIIKNEDIKVAVKNAVKKVDRDWWNGAVKRVIAVVGAVVLVLLGVLFQKFILGK
jgi:hypothetical protein